MGKTVYAHQIYKNKKDVLRNKSLFRLPKQKLLIVLQQNLCQRKQHKREEKLLQKRTDARKKLWVLFVILFLSLIGIGFYMKDQVVLLCYAFQRQRRTFFKNPKQKKNELIKLFRCIRTGFSESIFRITNVKKILTGKLTIANGAIDIRFILLRATMGKDGKDQHFDEYWKTSKRMSLSVEHITFTVQKKIRYNKLTIFWKL